MPAVVARGKLVDADGPGDPSIADRLLNPTLVAATTVMLLLDKPAKLMLGYLLGAYVTSITLGLVIVFSASNADDQHDREHHQPRGRHRAGCSRWSVRGSSGAGVMNAIENAGERARRPSRTRARRGGSASSTRDLPRTTFLVGMLLTLPGASYLAGLDDIHKLHYSTTGTVLLVIGFNLVMLWLLEVPLVSFVVAPEWTPRAVERAKAWVSRHAHMFAVRGLTALGALLVIKGIIGLT